MATIVNYLQQHRNTSFTDLPLNELDILILNEIGYLDFSKLITDGLDLRREVKLYHLWKDYQKKQENQAVSYDFLLTKERLELFKLMLSGKRFVDLCLEFYVNDISTEFEKQFSAMVFKLPQIEYKQLVFRGTDDSMIGWKEDFKLTYMREIPAHRSAIVYLTKALAALPGPVIVSGHSKGGNLAVYASTYVKAELQKKIAAVYMFDSPGLQASVLQSRGYQAIRKKVHVLRPQEAIVGVMLDIDAEVKIIDSSSFGIGQHKATNWQVDMAKDCLLPAKEGPTDLSVNLEKTFKKWTRDLSSQELKRLFDTLFDTIITSGISSLNDLSFDTASGRKLANVVASFRSIDSSKKILLLKSARLFFLAFVGHTRLAAWEKMLLPLPDFLKSAEKD
ncbi:Mbeg1-like protein [Streptococcus pantholopis]|uniref:Lipase n=1 Tax=Streptococcus pantholopis TaxID=1811193 RepID=A0A172Q7P0_9STRE|nr:Mbeg1-like protein [Streptococcus pantholopis]AND79513.1 lipase [Streptococcus pantholopis]